MKKLNKKGFTLIELLAVIVILAIIVVVTVPTILNSINDARVSSIHSLSKEVANWYDTSSAQDMIALDPTTTILKGTNDKVTSTWQCLKAVTNTVDGVTYNLFDLYGLSSNDVRDTSDTGATFPSEITDTTDVSKLCSAIRTVNGRAEVLIVGKDNGKFDTNATVTYGYSKLGDGSEYKAS